MTTRPGEIELRDATRSFNVRADQGGTLKGLLFGGRAPALAPVPALRGVTLRIAPGETVGIVGRNGAGKTSTLRVLAGIVPLQSGEVRCGGRIVSLLELGAGFGRDFSGRENIYLQGALYGFTRPEVHALVDRIAEFSELGDFIDIPIKAYSAGMLVRLGFSIVAHLDADIMLIDEVLAVGDEAFQRKCLRCISERIATGMTVVLVSHDAGAIERVCERVVVLDAGRVVFDGPTAEGLLHYHQLMGTEHGRGESIRPATDRPVQVAEVDLLDGAGRSSTVFASGSSLRIVLTLRATEHVHRPSVALEVRSQGGERVFRTVAPVTPITANAQLAFEIPSLSLLGGDYDLAIAAGDGSEEPRLDRTIRFSVTSAPGTEGLVDLGGSWQQLESARVGR